MDERQDGRVSRHRAIEPSEQAAAILTAAGMPRMPARVLMALVAAPDEGYTAADLADRLGASAAAISGAVRYLQTLQVVRRVSMPGQRRDRYMLVDDTWYAAVAGKDPMYLALASLIDRITEQTGAGVAAARSREMAEFFRFMAARMPQLLDEWEALRGTTARHADD